MRSIVHILSLCLLLASCSKDDAVAPLADGPGTFTSGDAFNKGVNNDGTSDPDSGTISDDGDDLNDGEGRRKKKKP